MDAAPMVATCLARQQVELPVPPEAGHRAPEVISLFGVGWLATTWCDRCGCDHGAPLTAVEPVAYA